MWESRSVPNLKVSANRRKVALHLTMRGFLVLWLYVKLSPPEPIPVRTGLTLHNQTHEHIDAGPGGPNQDYLNDLKIILN